LISPLALACKKLNDYYYILFSLIWELKEWLSLNFWCENLPLLLFVLLPLPFPPKKWLLDKTCKACSSLSCWFNFCSWISKELYNSSMESLKNYKEKIEFSNNIIDQCYRYIYKSICWSYVIVTTRHVIVKFN